VNSLKAYTNKVSCHLDVTKRFMIIMSCKSQLKKMAFRTARLKTRDKCQSRLRNKIIEVDILKRDIKVIATSHMNIKSKNNTLSEENTSLQQEVKHLSDKNVELNRQLEMYKKYMMTLAVRYPSHFEEITSAYVDDPQYCDFGPFESDV
jgi:chromosome segregation ATPase